MKSTSRKPSGCSRRHRSLSSRPWSLATGLLFLLALLATVITPGVGRKHHLVLHSDIRRFFPVSTFGYFPGGSLNITVASFKFRPSRLNSDSASGQFGFTLAQTTSNNYAPYMEGQRACLLLDDVNSYQNLGLISFKLDFKNKKVSLSCNRKLNMLTIISDNLNNRAKRAPPVEAAKAANTEVKETAKGDTQPGKQADVDSSQLSNGKQLDVNANSAAVDPLKNAPAQVQPQASETKPKIAPEVPQKKPAVPAGNPDDNPDVIFPESYAKENPAKKDSPKLDLESKTNLDVPVNRGEAATDGCLNWNHFDMKKSGSEVDPEYSFQFQMFVTEPHLQGLYALYFHNCLNYPNKLEEANGVYTSIDLDMFIEERNLNNFLSAGEIPLPQLYFALSVIFFILGTIWFYSLQNRASETFKIHYLMGILVFVKAISLLFHGINYYFIARDGTQVETWAILYYITHFLKGALMFITIVLIGTGWAFIKHILSEKDKKIFMIVIPLQVIANIADIITEESEEGALIHTVWRQIFILVDIACCGSILFPVIWSIRHLQEASQTDGKAAINLKKLQLFRHFYCLIVAYVYFTRIIVYLVKITVPFNYEWLDQLFQHVATLVFFILTGYRFQPASSNPYYQLLQEEMIEMDEEVLFIQPSTFTEAKKRNRDLEASSSDVQSLIGRGGGVNSYDYD